RAPRPLLPGALSALLFSACTLVNVGSEGGPPRVQSEGFIEGHAAVGIRDESSLLRVQLFDGESEGALAEVTLWKLFRFEVGALGVGVGVGPFDLALGAVFYRPRVPTMISSQTPAEAASVPATGDGDDDCELCRKARAQAQAQARANGGG